ncbi:MAG: MamI family restriction endonuclease [Tatlockia sp.]|nr:MamI family restriction endonuclease [Tatlockia sp.]
MQPDRSLITIDRNLENIEQLLHELVLQPRINALKWSDITKQTPNIKIGYPGQHLASLITGIPGDRTGARGHDLIDGSEVKSCSRIDQLDKCRDYKAPVARVETNCSECDSSNIERKDDSKWLFTIKSEKDLVVLTKQVERVLLIISDYPNFEAQDYDTLRFQSFEIWTRSERHSKFKEILTNYYQNIYLLNKNKSPHTTPAPQNFWPCKYQFYLCNPILTFSCTITNASLIPKIEIESYIEPHLDRSTIPSILMPLKILKKEERSLIAQKANLSGIDNLPEYIDENLRKYLSLRLTLPTKSASTMYQRRVRKTKEINLFLLLNLFKNYS